jgi:hypothetical protein
MIDDQAPLSQVLRIAVLIGLALAASGATHATAEPTANPVLFATVGTNDGFDIDLADANAVHVSRLTPGTYDIVVRDRSTLHNFHLASNSDTTVDFRTELNFVGEIAGSYRLVVQDNSRRANFHIRGNGVNRRTARRFIGTKRWTVKLAPGNYRFGSDPRLTGTLTVR